jgi:uracil-DNA glycosylase family 4
MHATWHNGPVPAFGPIEARLLVVGLAPGLRGANRTGRPFTGDFAGRLLYPSLLKAGLADGEYEESAADTLRLLDCRVSNAVRCVPPANKPLPDEFAQCRPFLEREIRAMPNLKCIVALGGHAHAQCLAVLGRSPRTRWPFAHGAVHKFDSGPVLIDSYHCSRLNTNTGRLTEAMFDAVVAEAKRRLGG